MTQNVLTNDEAVTWSKHFFRSIFLTFERYLTNLRGTFVLVPISTHPIVHYQNLDLVIFKGQNSDPLHCGTQIENNVLSILNGPFRMWENVRLQNSSQLPLFWDLKGES
jgi:hypothetical protein